MAKKASPGDWGEFIGEKGNLFGGEYVWLSLSKPLQDFSAVSPAGDAADTRLQNIHALVEGATVGICYG